MLSTNREETEKKKEKQTAKTGSITLAALPELKGGVPPLKHA